MLKLNVNVYFYFHFKNFWKFFYCLLNYFFQLVFLYLLNLSSSVVSYHIYTQVQNKSSSVNTDI